MARGLVATLLPPPMRHLAALDPYEQHEECTFCLVPVVLSDHGARYALCCHGTHFVCAPHAPATAGKRGHPFETEATAVSLPVAAALRRFVRASCASES